MRTTGLTRLARLATEFADQSTPDNSDEFVIPDTFDSLNDEQLDALHAEAMEHFDALYGDGSDLEDEPLAALAELTKGIEAISTEQAARREAAAERQAAAAELLARVRPEPVEEEEESEAPAAEAPAEEEEEETPAAEQVAEVEEREPALVASAEEPVAPKRGTTRIPMSSVRARSSAPAATPSADEGAASIRDALLASGEGLGVAVGTGVDWLEAGELLDRRLNTYNRGLYEHANASGRAVREQGALLSIKRDIPADLIVKNSNPEHVESVLQRAVDERQLVGGSLVASGGWCAPSETLYDLIELESSDGLLSLPEIGIARGGVSFTRGPSFADVFSQMTGFSFTEAQDIAGEYAPGEDGAPNVVGDKPCVRIECPEFEEYRLDVDGLCITGGLLGLKGYPELYARVLRGAQVAHRHRLNGKQIAEMVAGSTAVTMGAKEGTTAPLLDAIEMQVEHYRYSHRLSRGTTLEAVFPYWVRGAVRSDLSRRLGVELLAVTDAQIGSWFASRGVSPQFVYNWQVIDGGAADEFTAWPTEVSFLLYAAGTWIRGASDIITMDSLYDSTLLAQNDFTALFTEEGWFVAKRGHDSRVVTVGISADGATHIGVDIAHDGSIAAAGA